MQQEIKPKAEGALVKVTAAVFYFQAAGFILRHYLGVPDLLAFTISAAIVFIPAYWVSPKPGISFLRYAAIIGELVGAFAAALSIPDLLRRYMPIQLAVSLPLLVLCLPLYYVLLKLAPDPLRSVTLVKWALVILVTPIVVAGIATIRPDAR